MRPASSFLFAILCTVGSAHFGLATVQPALLFQDGIVLHREKPVSVWGAAAHPETMRRYEPVRAKWEKERDATAGQKFTKNLADLAFKNDCDRNDSSEVLDFEFASAEGRAVSVRSSGAGILKLGDSNGSFKVSREYRAFSPATAISQVGAVGCAWSNNRAVAFLSNNGLPIAPIRSDDSKRLGSE